MMIEVRIMFKNQKGFSLIELMVVVSIIGILSSIAVPQFQKFKKKAQQAEAKTLLSGIYTAQKIFSVEHNTYYSNLYAIGFEVGGVVKTFAGFYFGNATVSPPSSFSSDPLLIPSLYGHLSLIHI